MVAEKIAETDEEIIDLTEIDEEVIDLTELIDQSGAVAAAPAPEEVKEEASSPMQSLDEDPARQDEKEIDALLAQMEAHDDDPEELLSPEQAAAPSHKVDPNEKLDMSGMGDVDKLLSTLDIPPQPRERHVEAAQKAASADLDSAVDDLLNARSGSAPRPQSETMPDAHDLPTAAPQPGEQTFTDDLDALLASDLDAPTAQSAPAAASAAPAPDLGDDVGDDLDALLGDLDLNPPAAPASAPQTASAAKAAPQASPRTQSAPVAASAAPAPDLGDGVGDDLDALLGDLDLNPPSAPVSAPQTEPETPVVPEENAAEIEADLAELLESAMQEEPAPDVQPDVADTTDQSEAAVMDAAPDLEESEPALSGENPEAAPAGSEEAVAAELPVPPAEDPLLLSGEEESAPADAETDAAPDLEESEPALSGENPEPAPAGAEEAVAAELPVPPAVAPAGEPAPAAAESAQLTELAEHNARLSEHLQRCENELAEAKARISTLEKAVATPAASLEDLLREGSSLHDRFVALIASSVGQALKGLGAPGPDQALEERLHNLSLMNKSVSARLDALESRLDTLEPHFNQQVDKAAAAAAARILREEIAKLVQG